MIEKVFPPQLSNEYNGHIIAKWVFFLITIVTVARSLIHIFFSDGGAQSIATIPLDSFTRGGADTVILIFALWGVSQLLLGLLYVIVLWRYQALIPFMYLLLIVEYAMRFMAGILKPIELAGTAPGSMANYIFVPLAVIMFLLSIKRRN